MAATLPYWMYAHMDETQLAIKEKAKGDWKELTDVRFHENMLYFCLHVARLLPKLLIEL